MESWSYISEEKGYPYLSNNNTHTTPCGFSNDMLALGHQQNIENQGSQEMGFSEMLGKLEGRYGGGVPNAFSGSGGDSNSKLSNSVVVDSNCWDSLIDLKLGRFADHGGDDAAINVALSKGATMLSSSESSTVPSKRVRASSGVNSQSHTAYCQVYGCNKDLSSCKDYHKRHKVCEVHSKTPIVIVNGIQQRFCQQCSRFHLLAEFDDGKRSCRKRLAGHNERRRKPQAGIHSGKSGRLLQPCGDSIFHGMKLPPASFICPEVLPNGVMCSDKYGTSDFWRPMKAEHGASFRHLSSVPVANGLPQSRYLFPSYNEKQFPFLHENSATSTTGSIFCENNSNYPHAIAAQNSVLRPLFQDTSLGSEDFSVFHATSSIQELSGISDSCALSLLSSQSQNSSSRSSGIALAQPLVNPSSHSHHYSMSQVSERIGKNLQTSSNRMSDRFPSDLNPADGSHLGPILISDKNDIANFEMEDGIFQDSGFVNVKDCLSCEDGATIDLLQLSSQLQRVEHQRQSLQVNKESDSTCTLRIT